MCVCVLPLCLSLDPMALDSAKAKASGTTAALWLQRSDLSFTHCFLPLSVHGQNVSFRCLCNQLSSLLPGDANPET